MIRCADTERLATAFIDGELDERRASALRGHLRGCADCRARVAAEATLRDGLAELAPVDPPPSVWAGIEQRLAQAEESDAGRSRLWWWWQGGRRVAATAALALAGAAVIVWVGVGGRHRGDDSTRARTETTAPGQADGARGPAVAMAPDATAGPADPVASAPPPAAVMPSDAELTDQLAHEVATADQRYLHTVAELQTLVAGERVRWSPRQVTAFDARIAALEADVRARRVGIGDPLDLRGRDGLYRAYRAEISFLQEAVMWPEQTSREP